MKKTIRRCCLLTVAFALPVCAQELSAQREALRVIRETAADICTGVPLSGSSNQLELSGAAKAKLAGLVAKVADLGVEGAAKYKSSEYSGVLQEQLATAIKSSNDCKLTVFTTLVDKMLPIHSSSPQKNEG